MRGTIALGALVAVVAGCGEDDADGPIEVPAGPHHTFVVSKLTVGTSRAEAVRLGLDLDGKEDDGPDGADNQLGDNLQLVGVLFPELVGQTSTDAAVDHGDPIFLLSLRGPALGAGPLELHTLRGAGPMPAPCEDAQDPICRRHLAGTGTFTVGAERSVVPLTGVRDADGYRAGFGDIVMPFVFGERVAWLPLQRARVELDMVLVDHLAGRLGGVATIDDFHDVLIPVYAEAFRDAFAADCIPGGTPPACACRADSVGATVVGVFDESPQDCQISDAEVRSDADSLITADIDLDGDGANDGVSYAVALEAVAGELTP